MILRRSTKRISLSDIVSIGSRRTFVNREFSPLGISGLKLWLDASQITGLNDGDAVGTWADLSGNGNDATQATGSKKPTFQTNEINARPVVRGDGVDDLLACSTQVIPNSNCSVFVVLKAVTSGGGTYTERSFGNGDGAGTGGLLLLSGPQSGQDYLVVRNATVGPDIVMSGTIVFGVFYKYSIVMGAANTEAWVNGTSRGTSTLTSLTSSGNPLQLFCDGNSILCGNVDIAEFLVYDTALSTANRQLIEAYFAAKYAL